MSPYPTNNFYFAAYLLASDVPVMSFEQNTNGRVTFYFEESQQRIECFTNFTFGQAVVDVQKFIVAIKRLKSMIHDNVQT